MPHPKFRTVPDNLIEYAERALVYFEESRGYFISVEKSVLGFPYTPTFVCKRRQTLMIIEVDERLSEEKINSWVGYARSSGRDTQIAICLPSFSPLTQEEEDKLRVLGAGLYSIAETDVIERIAPRDLGLTIQLPQLASLSSSLRPLLGSAYEQFDRAQWREGFEDACQALENQARRYLKAGCKTGRIKLLTRKGPKIPKPSRIDKMTIGQLAKEFTLIQNQNHSDSVIGQALKRINKDRIGVAHHKSKPTTEKRLRANVGQHMWTIIAAMKEMS
jgi:hypothetical protein